MLRDQVSELEPELGVGDGEYRLLVGGLPLDGVVLPGVRVGVLLHVALVVRERPSEHPADIDDLRLAVVVLVRVPNVFRELVRPYLEVPAVDIAPYGPLAADALQLPAVCIDVVKRLPELDALGHYRVDGGHFVVTDTPECPRDASLPLGLAMGGNAVVVPLSVLAEAGFLASVAGIGERLPGLALIGREVLALAIHVMACPVGAALAAVGTRMLAVEVS